MKSLIRLLVLKAMGKIFEAYIIKIKRFIKGIFKMINSHRILGILF